MRKLYEHHFRRKNRNVLEPGKIVLTRQAARKSSRSARYYQVDAYRMFEVCLSDQERPNCFLISPTASGKSLIMVLMALAWIATGRKVIFVVPRNSIKGGFVSQDFSLEGKPIHWDAPVNLPENDELLTEGTREIKGLLDFLDGPPVDGEMSWICTYQTFITALEEAPELFEPTAVIMDEAHHLSSEGDDYSIRARNRGGAALAVLLRRAIPHMLCTATPYRADGNNILPQIDQNRYVTYTRQRADHISDFQYVEAYKTCVAVGNVMELLEARLIEAQTAGHKTLVALPHVASYHAQRFAYQLRLNHKDKDNKLQFEEAIIALCTQLGLSYASVVSDENFRRNDAKLRAAFIKLARDDSTKEDLAAIPDVTIVQERYKEGTDCVAWTLCIQIGLSSSSVFLSQFPGRVLRDHWSKHGHTVEFYTLVPDHEAVEQEAKAEWTFNIIKSLLVLSFMDVDLRRRQFRLPGDPVAETAVTVEDETSEQEVAELELLDPRSLMDEHEYTTLESRTPKDVEDAFDRYLCGTASDADLGLLNSSIPALPELPQRALENFAPRIPVDSRYLSDHEILFRTVTEKMIAFATVIGKYEAREFRNRLARSSGAHLDLEIERMYTTIRSSPQEIAAALQTDTQYVRKLLLAKGLLRAQEHIRTKRVTKRKRIAGTI